MTAAEREVRRLFPAAAVRAARLRRGAGGPQAAAGPDLTRYRDDPCGFARDRLRVILTADQESVLQSLLSPPGRVMVKSGHNTGKTFGAAVAVAWWYYTRPRSVVITTAPTDRAVKDLLWTEVRLLVKRSGLPNHLAPADSVMRDPAAPEEHWAVGYTSSTGESFQGRHRANMLFVFDEAEGVEPIYWTTTGTMFKPEDGHAWLALLNPTTTTSQSYREELAVTPAGDPKWRVYQVSSLDHPNVAVGLANRERTARGEPPAPLPVPNAVGLDQVEAWFADWFEPVPLGDEADPTVHVEFPPGSGRWYAPDPDGESRVLGRRPSAGTYGVWPEAAWAAACRSGPSPPAGVVPDIGCDVARFGDDRTEIHWRTGPVSEGHEDHGGWDVVKTADRLMRLAGELAADATARQDRNAAPIDPKRIPIKVDDTGVGGGVTDILTAAGYNAIPVNAGGAAADPDRYPRVRDELWFRTKELAVAGKVNLSRLGGKRLAKLKPQALAVKWKPTADRRRQVESKEELKKADRLGRSPDGMDAVNLAYYEPGGFGVPHWVERDDRDRRPRVNR